MTVDEARAAIGRKVVYRAPGVVEEGVITSVGECWIFVRYGNKQTSAATRATDLEPCGWKP